MNCEDDMTFKCRLHSVSDHSQLSSTEWQSVWWSNVRQKLEVSSGESRHSLTYNRNRWWLCNCLASPSWGQYYFTLSCQGTWNIQSNIGYCHLQCYRYCSTSDWCPCTPGTVHLITLHKWCTHTFISAPVIWWFSLRLEQGRDITHNLLEDLITQSAGSKEVTWSTSLTGPGNKARWFTYPALIQYKCSTKAKSVQTVW